MRMIMIDHLPSLSTFKGNDNNFEYIGKVILEMSDDCI